LLALEDNILQPVPVANSKTTTGRAAHGWLMKGKTARLLPLLHTLVEERAGERRFPTNSPPFMSQPCPTPVRFIFLPIFVLWAIVTP
jgi:hypothetical protein